MDSAELAFVNLALCSLVIKKGDASLYLRKQKTVILLPPKKYQELKRNVLGLKRHQEIQERCRQTSLPYFSYLIPKSQMAPILFACPFRNSVLISPGIQWQNSNWDVFFFPSSDMLFLLNIHSCLYHPFPELYPTSQFSLALFSSIQQLISTIQFCFVFFTYFLCVISVS